MEQKVCMITGANSGIGKAAAIQIAQLGHHVILGCRNREKGERALIEVRQRSGNGSVELMTVDLSLKSSIQLLAQNYLDKYDRLDILIHNAAIFDITQKEPLYTQEGVESVWATNHIGPVLLTELLLKALRNGKQGRVITIASKGLIAKPFLKVDIEDPEFKKRPFNVENAYYQSKLAQIMYTTWLAEKTRLDHITANCIRVPAVRVDIEKFGGLPSFMKKAYEFKSKFALTPEDMAKAYTDLALSDDFNSVTGTYFDEKLKPLTPSNYIQQAGNIEKVMNLTMSYL